MTRTPRIRIGNQTAKAARHWLDPFRFAMRCRFDAFEWFEDHEGDRGFCFECLSNIKRQQLRRIAQKRDVTWSVHAPLHANLLDKKCHGLRSALAFARDIGAKVVVAHTPSHADAAPPAIATGLAHWTRQAAKHGITIAMENTVDTSPAMLNATFAALKRKRDGKALLAHAGLCFDMGHANLFHETRNDYVGYLRALDAHVPIRHVHAHENFGDADAHLPLFAGPSAHNPAGIEMTLEHLRERAFVGCIILEQWPHPAHMLCEARDRLRALLHATPALQH